MPYYEYHCPSNGRTMEVRHGMNERLSTWSELAERAGTKVGSTPEDAPVERLMSAPAPLPGGSAQAAFQGCGTGCGCARQA